MNLTKQADFENIIQNIIAWLLVFVWVIAKIVPWIVLIWAMWTYSYIFWSVVGVGAILIGRVVMDLAASGDMLVEETVLWLIGGAIVVVGVLTLTYAFVSTYIAIVNLLGINTWSIIPWGARIVCAAGVLFSGWLAWNVHAEPG